MGKERDQNRRPGSLIAFRRHLASEAEALLTRLQQQQAFDLVMPMVSAANVPESAQEGINQLLVKGAHELRQKVQGFIRKMRTGTRVSAAQGQKEFALLKLRFNALLDQLDIFSDVLTQRGEHETGIWLAGLDTVAKDALANIRPFLPLPPMITYLDRGHGAAIRRARTRLPGGKTNPVAVIRVPRERMVSSGIASSLIHEVGHQGAALLGLLPSLRESLKRRAIQEPSRAVVWQLFERWISEIVSDCWAVATIGVSSTAGLMGVVSLPRYFVFRMNQDGPHPFPWIRVKISIAFGAAMYPDPQWHRLDQLWNQLYPLSKLSRDQQQLIRQLEDTIPAFVQHVLRHRTPILQGRTLVSVFPVRKRQPARLRQLFKQWQGRWSLAQRFKPSLTFAVLGQARADQRLSPTREARLLTDLLRHWARNRNV